MGPQQPVTGCATCDGIKRPLGPDRTRGVARFPHPENSAMDRNRVERNWIEVKGMVKEKWAKFTDDDLTAINGQREGRPQKRYEYTPTIKLAKTSTRGSRR
jgi:uncharacterized protein YjbJ (UPF0337 family)